MPCNMSLGGGGLLPGVCAWSRGSAAGGGGGLVQERRLLCERYASHWNAFLLIQ